MFLITILHQEDIRSVYNQCHVDSQACTEYNVNKHTSLTTLCSYFLLSYGKQAMTKSAHWWSWSCDLHGNLGGVFSQENTAEGDTEIYKSSFFSYKQVSGRNGHHE